METAKLKALTVKELSKLADFQIELPMRGIKQSLNVAVAVGVVGYELSRYYTQNIQH